MLTPNPQIICKINFPTTISPKQNKLNKAIQSPLVRFYISFFFFVFFTFSYTFWPFTIYILLYIFGPKLLVYGLYIFFFNIKIKPILLGELFLCTYKILN